MKFEEEKFLDTIEEVFDEIRDVLLIKGKQYGHEVQAVCGEPGNIYRLMDKIFRLKNIVIDNPGVADSEDSWLDLLGYAFLGVLSSRGYFKNEAVEHKGGMKA